MIKQTKKFIFIITLLVVVFAVMPALAATTVLFSPSSVSVEEGRQFTLRLIVYPHEVENYTAMIQVRYPEDLLKAESFNFIGDWFPVLQPGYDGIDNTEGVLIKTAGYPGGFSEPKVFGEITFVGKKTGKGVVRVGGYSMVFDKSSQNVLVGPLGQVSVSVEMPGTGEGEAVTGEGEAVTGEGEVVTGEGEVVTGEEEIIPLEEEITPEEEEIISPEEEEIISPEEEEIISPEEEIIPTPLFDVIIEPEVKEKRNIMPIIIIVLFIVAILIVVSSIIYRRKKKSLLKDEGGENEEDNQNRN